MKAIPMYRLMRKSRETEEFSMVKLYENNKIFSSKTHGAEILDTVSPKLNSCLRLNLKSKQIDERDGIL